MTPLCVPIAFVQIDARLGTINMLSGPHATMSLSGPQESTSSQGFPDAPNRLLRKAGRPQSTAFARPNGPGRLPRKRPKAPAGGRASGLRPASQNCGEPRARAGVLGNLLREAAARNLTFHFKNLRRSGGEPTRL